MGVTAMKIFAQEKDPEKLNGKTSVDNLIRYSLSLPVGAVVLGMPKVEFLEQNVAVAKAFQPMTPTEMKGLNTQLNQYKASIDAFFLDLLELFFAGLTLVRIKRGVLDIELLEKATGALHALALEADHDKREILECYLNHVYYGHVGGLGPGQALGVERPGDGLGAGMLAQLERAIVVGPIARLELIPEDPTQAAQQPVIEVQIPASQYRELGLSEGELLVLTPRKARVFVNESSNLVAPTA